MLHFRVFFFVVFSPFLDIYIDLVIYFDFGEIVT